MNGYAPPEVQNLDDTPLQPSEILNVEDNLCHGVRRQCLTGDGNVRKRNGVPQPDPPLSPG